MLAPRRTGCVLRVAAVTTAAARFPCRSSRGRPSVPPAPPLVSPVPRRGRPRHHRGRGPCPRGRSPARRRPSRRRRPSARRRRTASETERGEVYEASRGRRIGRPTLDPAVDQPAAGGPRRAERPTGQYVRPASGRRGRRGSRRSGRAAPPRRSAGRRSQPGTAGRQGGAVNTATALLFFAGRLPRRPRRGAARPVRGRARDRPDRTPPRPAALPSGRAGQRLNREPPERQTDRLFLSRNMLVRW